MQVPWQLLCVLLVFEVVCSFWVTIRRRGCHYLLMQAGCCLLSILIRRFIGDVQWINELLNLRVNPRLLLCCLLNQKLLSCCCCWYLYNRLDLYDVYVWMSICVFRCRFRGFCRFIRRWIVLFPILRSLYTLTLVFQLSCFLLTIYTLSCLIRHWWCFVCSSLKG